MTVARRALLGAMAASAAAPAILRLACADAPQVTLKLHHFFSSVAAGHAKFLAPWARKVETDADGSVRIDIFPSMQLGGAPGQLFDQVRDGVADIVLAAPSMTPGRFPRVEAFELPFVPACRALVNSRAVQDYAAAHLGAEFREVHPLCFSCRDAVVVHTEQPVDRLAALKNLKLHVPNRFAAEAARAVGARGVAAPIPQVPTALATHVIDGCLDPWDVVPRLHLSDLLKSHTEIPEKALSTTTYVLAMNRRVYERLPPQIRSAIDGNSDQVAAGMAGAMWDVEAAAVAAMVRERGNTVTMLPSEEAARWRKAAEPSITAWVKQMRQRRIDGGALLESIRGLLDRYAGEPQPLPPAKPAPAPEATAQPQQTPPAVAAPKPGPAAGAAAATPAPPAPKPKELDIPL